MKKFLLLYGFNIIVLFSIFYLDISPISKILNSFQTDFISYLTSMLLPINQMQGNEIIINSQYTLIIEKACNGIIPYLFFIASILAFPSTNRHKIFWALYGYIILNIINIFRIWLIIKLVLKKVDNFSLAHDFIGNSLLIFTSLSIFILFVKTIRVKNN